MTEWRYSSWPGRPYPLGATWDGEGVNFSLFSETAEGVELCIFDPRGHQEVQRIPVRWQTDQIWHCYLPDARPGLLYGYRVRGPHDPARGLRFNPNKLLLDPYARDFEGKLEWSDAHFGYRIGDPEQDLSFDERDSAPGMPKCRVIDSAFTWGEDVRPRTPWHETIIYEAHVRGMTLRHPDVREDLRGTYAGLVSGPIIDHLRRLGITAIELMPVHSFVDDRHLVEREQRNYWGYNTIGFFAPDLRYSATGLVHEFKTMVKRLHSAGIEVILDVVYNHTAEGSHLGPTLSFRGIDNLSYYRVVADDARHYMDFTGCGNTLNMRHPRVLQLIMDSLRYWVEDMHVDGFRFDLASTLARELHEVDRLSSFFDIINQDPVLSQVKLIAEPWDLGDGGYQVGNFPVGWVEWNGKYRDALRSYWKGDGNMIGEVAYRLTGSSDLYEQGGRRPYASVNFLTAHDGFTLRDLVSYNDKHNEANGEENRDGESHNRSWNCGVEGNTEDPAIIALREKQKRNLLATLMLSQGVPMLLGGDEFSHTKNGNNNTYCQDNELSWLSWELSPRSSEFLRFVQNMIHIRRAHPIFRRRRFFSGGKIKGADVKDIVWLSPEGGEMTDEEWNASSAGTLGVFLSGEATGEVDERCQPIVDDDFLLLMNARSEAVRFPLPQFREGARWMILADTVGQRTSVQKIPSAAPDPYPLEALSMAVLTVKRAQPEEMDVEVPAAHAVPKPRMRIPAVDTGTAGTAWER